MASQGQAHSDAGEEKRNEMIARARETAQAAKEKLEQAAQAASVKTGQTAEGTKKKSSESTEAAKEKTAGLLQHMAEAGEQVKSSVGMGGENKESGEAQSAK
ncbi:Late embryogenesis abundant protein 2 [Apostasia shenzhenica]|uniref:Late embryogenesis abundant protein 2 n=1 Tax=Apostasia shenzhenica TaxID=1088818 RepID=A0A2I0A0I8_9ASPA|nr:Late embryogenesis abundant protein 2 [Apostasia shenzhenica]